MLSRAIVCLLLAASLCACGPTYSIAVYDGGLPVSDPATVTSAAALAPTEAAVAYSTDYAPPAENTTYAGPTNRVVTEVPEGVPYHAFVGVTRSIAPQGVAMVGPARLAQADMAPSEAAKPVSQRLLAASEEVQVIAKPESDLSLEAVRALAAEAEISAAAGRAVALGVESDAHSAGLQAPMTTRGSQALSAAHAAVEPVEAAQPMAAETTRALDSYEKISAPRLDVLAEAAQAGYETRTAREEIDVRAARDAGVAAQPLGVDNAAGVDAYTISKAAALRTGVGAAQTISRADVAQLLVKRHVVKDIGNARLLLAAETVEGWLVYRRVAVTRLVTVSKNLRSEESSLALAGREKPSGVSALAGVDVAMEAGQSENVLQPEGRKSLASYANVSNVRKGAWVAAPRSVASVSPPEIFVLKEARLIDGDGIQELLDAGVIRDRPLSPMVIGYRIHVFNPGSSAVAGVKVLDRLDLSTTLLVNSMSTNSDDATATYWADVRAIDVELPRLPSGGHFLVEFYVDVVTAR